MKNKKLQSGFTLVEMVVAVGIATMLIAVIFSLQNYVIRQQQFTINSYLTVETANTAMQILEREIKNARQGDNGTHLFENMSDQELIFYSNADGDDDIERIRYYLDGTQLIKGTTEPTSFPVSYPTETETTRVLNDHIRNGETPIFTYYNRDWPSDTTNNPLESGNRLSNTRLIGVHLVVNSNQNEVETDHVLDSYIHIRTIKDNL